MVAEYEAQGYLPNGMDFVKAGDMDVIAAPTDFMGVNYYTRKVSRDENTADNLPQTVFRAPASELTEMGWEIYPEGLYNLLNRFHFGYQIPKLYITENGCSYMDGPDGNGRIADQRRIDYLRGHLDAVARAIKNGAPVAGYMQWSLLDNFEWAHGYQQRFGIVYVDYETQQRYPKDSALWYRDVIARNGLSER
jgi:beta-glucosidase